ncbi:MAG: replicative DNA helicase [Alphaproteobacteria bacterium]|jgi:replicative DNA helicase|nr:replicative DNA helicase [Alphaproteobacteria bacterium]
MTNVVPIGADKVAPPHNAAIEQQVLGGVMRFPHAYERVATTLRPEHFFLEVHQRIYARVQDLMATRGRVSPAMLAPDFQDDPALAVHGGCSAYLSSLAGAAAMMIDIEGYAALLLDLAQRRDLLMVARRIIDQVQKAGQHEAAQSLIDDAEAMLSSVAEGKAEMTRATASIREAGQNVLKDIEEAKGRKEPPGFRTGLDALDALLGGFQASDLVIIAGRPGMGKSALAVSLARRFALKGFGVAFYSLEMSRRQIAQRFLAEETSIAYREMRDGSVEQDDFERLIGSVEQHDATPFWINDRGAQTVGMINSDIRRLRRRRDIHIVVIDYLQLLRGNAGRYENRVAEVTDITTRLKAMAKEHNVCMIALAQLSRATEGRQDKKPQLSDLRESGSIEQDADLVLFPFRKHYYLQRETHKPDTPEYHEWLKEMAEHEGRCEIIIGKHRHGPEASCVVLFDPATNRFDNRAA